MSSAGKDSPLINNEAPVAAASVAVANSSPIAEPGIPALGLASEVTPDEPEKSLDVNVVVDDTGSMAEMLDAVKTVACDMMAMYQNHPAYAGWKIRFSVIAFNDWKKSQYIKGSYKGTVENSPTLTWCPFTEDVNIVRTAIQGIVAHGGDDMPEDVAGALKLASRLTWNGTAKVLIFATDACGHGFTNGSDHFPNGDPMGETKATTLATMTLLANMGVDFTFINIRPANSESMRLEFKKVYEDALAENPNAGTFTTQDMVAVQPSRAAAPAFEAFAEDGLAAPDMDADRADDYAYHSMALPDPHFEGTPSAAAMVMAISRSSSDSIRHRTGLTPMADYESPVPIPPMEPVMEEMAAAACSSEALPPLKKEILEDA